MAMDTATDTLGVGVGSSDGMLASGVVQRVPRGHSRLLQPSIAFAMESSGTGMQDLERIGIGVGPGSYTGVRMAVATGKAMAQALSVAVVPIPTVDAIAECAYLAMGEAQLGSRILVMLNARRSRAYGALYEIGRGQGGEGSSGAGGSGEAGPPRRLEEIAVRRVDDWLRQLSGSRAAEDVPQALRGAAAGFGPTVIVHDFSIPLPSLDQTTQPAAVLNWRTLSGLLPEALVRLTASGHYPTLTGDAIHPLEPMYVLPVEAEANLGVTEGGRSQ
ncbi:tRNA (adenosine(37)-N6)-threonylcarbamoyltransferase complex dimerization subunit type 1 TsaB [Alicyclobacillus acidiphilus]|uniref:tRNA (adenosine(37)-N6)-threonylcarbamoyltransferase complex dimerization subunit type 1 TsaB n=1 Tax=Alicyclobacillus acidiphilus TaxID=182455 RepID=UPI000A6BECCA|nr:tRNA (adenosine(37)-N6)-threonylcarbamoyltransferase complex dimerization subunit type 1 TsaB [Alicyclobacillus acidiphilus]